MSNPAVVKLQKKTIYNQAVWLDDNFGESIHLHINNIRADLTVLELDKLCSDICDALNKLLSIDGLDIHQIDKTYLESVLCVDLLNIKSVSLDKVRLGKLLCPNAKGELIPLPASRGVRALMGDTEENDQIRYSHHIGQTSDDRLNRVMVGIKEHPYPYNGQYIVIYNDDCVIRDGQHRASCLYYLYGDIEVEVMRIFFNNRRFEKKKANIIKRGFAILKRPSQVKSLIRRLLKKLKLKIAKIKTDVFLRRHKDERDHIISILNEK